MSLVAEEGIQVLFKGLLPRLLYLSSLSSMMLSGQQGALTRILAYKQVSDA